MHKVWRVSAADGVYVSFENEVNISYVIKLNYRVIKRKTNNTTENIVIIMGN